MAPTLVHVLAQAAQVSPPNEAKTVHQLAEAWHEALSSPFGGAIAEIVAWFLILTVLAHIIWLVPPFSRIKRIHETLEQRRVKVEYQGTYFSSALSKPSSARLSMYWIARASREAIDSQLDDLIRMGLVFGLGQVSALIYAYLRGGDEGLEQFKVLLHYPVGEAVLLVVFIYWAVCFSLSWRRSMSQWVRPDVWKQRL